MSAARAPRPFGLRSSPATALIDAETGLRVPYRELARWADELGDLLDSNRSLVFLLCRNDLFTVAAYIATQMRGHVAALLDAAADTATLDGLRGAYRPAWVAGPPGTATGMMEAGIPVRSVSEWLSGEWVRLDDAAAAELHPDLALLLSTSGTTGTRRFVRLSRRNLDSNAAAIASFLGIGPEERAITSLPLHYTFGLSVLNSHLSAGATTIVTAGSVIQGDLWEAVREHRCTSLAGVPYTYELLERVGFRDMDLPSITSMLVAGGALDRTLTMRYRDHMEERGGRLVVMYGQTEATARMAYVPPEVLAAKLGSAGIAIPGGRFRIAASDPNLDGPPDRPASGEVIYEGPNVMLGYATDGADLRLGDELGGILPTGDLGYLDADGYLFLVGRSKRIAKVFGIRVNLDEVELMLRAQGPAAVVAGDGSIWGFCAFGDDVRLAGLRQQLARQLHLHHSAIHLARIAELPQSGTGKVDYTALGRLVP